MNLCETPIETCCTFADLKGSTHPRDTCHCPGLIITCWLATERTHIPRINSVKFGPLTYLPRKHIMTGRYDGRPERQNEYFIPGDGISREVIQADICRYLGNDALVRPGNHNVRLFFFPIVLFHRVQLTERQSNRVAKGFSSVLIGISPL